MKALTVHTLGEPPCLSDRPRPVAGAGEALLEVIAAPLNPVDVWIAGGRFFAGHPPLPFVPGVELVGRVETSEGIASDTLVWTSLDGLGVARDGGIAEWAVARDRTLVPLRGDVDPVLAAAVGTAGLAAWIPFTRTAPITRGETVLILGATGTVGRIALQVARLLGAGRIVAAGRDTTALDRLADLGADATVAIADLESLIDDLRRACDGDGPTLVLDPLWGEPAVAAVTVAAPGARLVQLGQSAGSVAPMPSAPVRGKGLTILGYTNVLLSPDELASGYGELLDHVAAGRIRVDLEVSPLTRADTAWARQAAGPRVKQVVCP